MTIGDELETLLTTRQNLITAINNKGQTVGQNDTIVSMYPKIKAIENYGPVQRLLKEIVEGTVEGINDDTCTILRSYCLQKCNQLKIARFSNLRKICQHAFDSCTRFDTLILDTTKMVYLENINAFRYTLIENSTGKIYVKDSLVDTYKTNENWHLFADKIVALSTYQD